MPFDLPILLIYVRETVFLFTSSVAEFTASFKAGDLRPPSDMLVSDNNIVKKFA